MPAASLRRATSHSGSPMLPAATASSPVAVMRWATSAVVVVFPLVPVSADEPRGAEAP